MRPNEESVNDPVKLTGSRPITDTAIHPRPGAAKGGFLDMTALIRSIQRAEGNPDCFLKGGEDCAQLDCAWRPYCLKSKRTFAKKED